MADRVFINDRSAVHKGARAQSTAFPDVCLCPPPSPIGPVPTPLVNLARAADLQGGTESVLIEDQPMAKRSSFIGTSSGNELAQATGGGVCTGVVQGAAHPQSYAMNVLIEGEGAVRFLDLFTHNHLNPPNTGPSPIGSGSIRPQGRTQPVSTPKKKGGKQQKDVTVIIDLRMCFSLEPPSPKGVRSSRWKGGKDHHFVPGATIKCTSCDAGCVAATSGPKEGNSLKLVFPPSLLGKKHTLLVSPAKGCETSAPAGTSTAKKDKNPLYMHRPFSLEIELDEHGLKKDPVIKIEPKFKPDGSPDYAVLFSVALPGRVTIDWKPDWIQSPNCSPREVEPTYLVLHHTGGTQVGSTIFDFWRTKPEVIINERTGKKTIRPVASAHYLIDVDGHVIKMVHEKNISDHAGGGYWRGEESINDTSIGIELVNSDDPPAPYPKEQMDALVGLVNEIVKKFPIKQQDVVGHCDVSDDVKEMGRELDPGCWFYWSRIPSLKPLPLTVEQVKDQPPKLPPDAKTALPTQPVGAPPTIYGIGSHDHVKYGQNYKAHHSTPKFSEIKKDLAKIGYKIGFAKKPDFSNKFDKALLIALKRFNSHFGLRTLDVTAWRKEQEVITFDVALLIKQLAANFDPRDSI